MMKRFLTVELVAVGLTGFVMASQWGYAAEPPPYPVPATPEMMQLVRDEHALVADMVKAQLAAETDRYADLGLDYSVKLPAGALSEENKSLCRLQTLSQAPHSADQLTTSLHTTHAGAPRSQACTS
jgi:hypothetical protein